MNTLTSNGIQINNRVRYFRARLLIALSKVIASENTPPEQVIVYREMSEDILARQLKSPGV